MAALRGKGARLALDDFGTGTSGLAQLLRLPLDELKLDRAFTRSLGLDGRSERIIEGSVRLAASMGMRVVAEGIEDEDKARQLRDLGCDMGQGWLFARPMPAEDLWDWLMARHATPGVVVPLRRLTV
jgi:EAL domain-containing protein (putative c-di-GMP-specific phosphodiesterase class I)